MVNRFKDFIFGKGALDKAANSDKPAVPGNQSGSQDTSYLQNIVKQRMAEKMAPKPNPLATVIEKSLPTKKAVPASGSSKK